VIHRVRVGAGEEILLASPSTAAELERRGDVLALSAGAGVLAVERALSSPRAARGLPPGAMSEVREGRLRVLRQRPRRVIVELDPAASSVLGPAEEAPAFVVFEARGKSGDPMKGLPFRLVDPDGKVEKGKLDDAGTVKKDPSIEGKYRFALAVPVSGGWEIL
jgi:hypothetical protein